MSLGGAAAITVSVISPSIITATTRRHAAGVTDVAITSSATTRTLGGAFTYLNTIVLSARTNLVATATSTDAGSQR